MGTIFLTTETTRPFTRTNGRHRDATRVFQGIGIRNAYAQPPWSIPCRPNRFLYIVEHIRMYVFSRILIILILISLDLIATAFPPLVAFPGSGNIPPPIPAMHDASDDAYHDLFCSIPTCINGRCISEMVINLCRPYPGRIPNSPKESNHISLGNGPPPRP